MRVFNRNFDEALRFSHEGVEDSLVNWLGLVVILAIGVVPIVVMQRNRTKPLKKRREVFGCGGAWDLLAWLRCSRVVLLFIFSQALRSLTRNRLTASSINTYKESFHAKRRQYVNDPAFGRESSQCLICFDCL